MPGPVPLLSVVLPTYNEAENVPELLRRVRKALNGLDYEVVFVDDDSPDGTPEAIKRESGGDPRVRLFVRKAAKGLATAMIYGMRVAKGRFIAFMDADLQHPPEVIPKMLDAALRSGADLVVASRYADGGGTRGWSATRSVISRGATLLAELLAPECRRTSDPMSGFFLFRNGAVDPSKLKADSIKVLLDTLYRHPGLKVVDVPYVFGSRPKGESKTSGRVMFDYFVHLLKISKPVKFSVALISGVLISVAVMYSFMKLGLVYDLASALGIEVAVLSAYAFRKVWGYRERGGGLAGRLAWFHAAVGPAALSMYLVMKAVVLLTGVYPPRAQILAVLAGLVVYYAYTATGLFPARL